jgi:SNF2 family DNA or RNA helicase
MTARPLSWQEPAIAAHIDLLKTNKAVLEASGTGYGKTYVAGFVARHFGLKVAVVCPKSVIGAWEQVMADIGVEVVFVTNYEMLQSKKFEYGRWRIKRRVYEWDLPPDALLIFDEVHRCKSKTTNNAKYLKATIKIPNRVLMMSATVAENPLHLFAIGGVLGLHSWDDPPLPFFHWMYQMGVRKVGFAYEWLGSEQDILRLHKLIFPKKGHRVRVEGIRDFPENKIETLPVSIEDVEMYDELLAKIEELEQKRAEDSLDAGDITEMLRARQEAEMLKAPAMAALGIDLVAEGHSVPIFVNFRASHELILNALEGAGIPCSTIVGGQKPGERDEEIRLFQTGQTRCMVAMIQAGGVGISLHDTEGDHPRVSLISPSFNAVELKQALGRSCRAGGKTKTVQRIVFAAKTIEEGVRRKVEKKLANIELLNDGDLSL